MEWAEKEALRKYRHYLCKHLQIVEVLAHLEANAVITEFERQLINAEKTDFEKNGKFLDILSMKGSEAFSCFISALTSTQQSHIVDEILGQEKRRNNSDAQFKSLQKSLKEMYLERFKTTNPFSLPFTYNVENTWVSLALKENTKHAKGTENHAELLKQAFAKERMLIIEGNPATGKTTLMRRLAYEWASGKPELMHYDLIIYAEFRELRNQNYADIVELVTSYLQSYVGKENCVELRKIVTDKKWYVEDKHMVLVLLDGFDESSSKDQCAELYGYLTNDTLGKRPIFNIVMTTRPGHLPPELKEQEGRFVFAEVLGFTTDEKKMKYISNHFAKDGKGEAIYNLLKSQEIQELTKAEQQERYLNQFSEGTEVDVIKIKALSVYFMLKSNESLSILAETPLFLVFICLVHKKIIDDNINGKTDEKLIANNPLLDLYCNIVRWLLDRHQRAHEDTINVPKLFDYPQECNNYELKKMTIQNYYLHFPQLHNLGNMALHNLERNSFLQSDLDRFKVHSIVEQVGLLRKEEKFDKDFNTTTEFSFLHRTFQEFLAAFSYMNGTPTEFSFMHRTFQEFLAAFSYMNGLSTQVTTQTISNDVKKFMKRDIFDKKIPPFNIFYITGIPYMTEYEKFLWRIVTSEKLPISPQMRSNFFESYSTLVLDLDIFSSSAENCIQQLITCLKKCSNITKLFLVFRGCSFQGNLQLSCTNLPVLKRTHFVDCSFQENSQLSCTNLPVLEDVCFERCSFQKNSQLNCTNLQMLKEIKFVRCSFQENSRLSCTNLQMLKEMNFVDCSFQENSQLSGTTVLKHMYFDNCSFQGNSQLSGTNLPVLVYMRFVRCSFQENSQLSCTNLPVLEDVCFERCSFQKNSKLSWTNLPVLNYMYFRDCSFQKNSQLNYANLPALKGMDFVHCSLQENSKLSWTNLPVLNYIYFRDCSFQENSRLSCTNLQVLKEINFDNCSFHENSQLSGTNLPVLRKMNFDNCSFQENSQLNCIYLPELKYLRFNGCLFSENSQLSCTNLRVLIKMDFVHCSLQENSKLSWTNLPVLNYIYFWDCSFQKNSQLNCTNLPALKGMDFMHCSLQENSKLSWTNLPVLNYIYFRDCSFQENSRLSCTNLQVLKEINFVGSSFQENSEFNCTYLPELKYLCFNGCLFYENSQPKGYYSKIVQRTSDFSATFHELVIKQT